MSKAKNWCFTLNNPSSADYEGCQELRCVYLIFQLEEGQQGTPHLQGFFSLESAVRLKGVQALFDEAEVKGKPHFEVARGTALQNKTYCSKEEGRLEGPFEKGELPGKNQGSRTDLNSVAEDVAAGATLSDIAEQYPVSFIKHHKGIEALQSKLKPILSRGDMPIVSVYWGASGSGKSFRAFEEAKALGTTYLVDFRASGQVDWSGYENQTSVIINDFYGCMKWSHLLKLLDRYPNKVSALYCAKEFNSKYIFITSNKHPRYWYPKIEDIRPLIRRCCVIDEMNQRWHPSVGVNWPIVPHMFFEMSVDEVDKQAGLRPLLDVMLDMKQPHRSESAETVRVGHWCEDAQLDDLFKEQYGVTPEPVVPYIVSEQRVRDLQVIVNNKRKAPE